MSEYTVKLVKGDKEEGRMPQVEVDALTEFEAAAVGLNRFRELGEEFDGRTGVEIIQGNVTETKPVPVKDIVHWLRDRREGQALAERDGLGPLIEYVKE
jgi:hypothetical protein